MANHVDFLLFMVVLYYMPSYFSFFAVFLILQGIRHLLSCKEAIPFLKQCLPKLAGCFDDVNVTVRVAMVQLLLKVQSLKVIKFWEIVHIHSLLHRLAADSPTVCKLLTKLLVPTFFPVSKDDTELLERCITLIGEDRAASRVFFEHASKGLDISSVVRVTLLLFTSLRGYLLHKTQQQENLEISRGENKRVCSRPRPSLVSSQEDKENCEPQSGSPTPNSSVDEEEESPFDDPSIVGGVLDTIVILWTVNTCKLRLQHNKEWLNVLQRKISRGLPLLSTCFKGNCELSQTLLYLASFLPRNMVPTLVSHCTNMLKGMTEQDIKQADQHYLIYVNALCNWNQTKELLELIEQWLSDAFDSVISTNGSEVSFF